LQRISTLSEARAVDCVDEEDDAVDFGEVVFPDPLRLCVAAEVKGFEVTVADAEFFAVGLRGRRVDSESIGLQEMEESRLPSIIEAEEEDFRVFIPQPEASKEVPEPIKKPHIVLLQQIKV